jgi:GNAT superfamily N-acetyltransferase
VELPELTCPAPADHALIDRLARMMGACFTEERWTQVLLDSLGDDASPQRRLAVAQGIMAHDFAAATPYRGLWATPDEAACAGAYLKSDLGDAVWGDIEAAATARFVSDVLTPSETVGFLAAQRTLGAVSVFDWEEERAAGRDFIHFYALGVDPARRGSGAFRQLIEPFLAYADDHGIPCYLETYTDELRRLYEHFGFHLVDVRTARGCPLVERCMERPPAQ